jgi:anti-anti-sigma regulatory factor
MTTGCSWQDRSIEISGIVCESRADLLKAALARSINAENENPVAVEFSTVEALGPDVLDALRRADALLRKEGRRLVLRCRTDAGPKAVDCRLMLRHLEDSPADTKTDREVYAIAGF